MRVLLLLTFKKNSYLNNLNYTQTNLPLIINNLLINLINKQV